MMINKKLKRLKAVKGTYPLIFPTKCDCCENKFIREQMFKIKRWGLNKTHSWYYCKNCAPTKEDVLNKIDTDNCPFGIAFIDGHIKESILKKEK